MKQALIIGSKGTLGEALVTHLSQQYAVATLSRDDTDYSPQSLQQHYQRLRELGPFSIIICCIGVLHDKTVSPEKSLKNIDAQRLMHYYQVNSILPMLCLQHFYRLLDCENPSVFACLSAMVGSIGENELGGWYGYRSSKAALNMLVKNTAIEVKRSNEKASIIAIHPGTTVGTLTKPFAKNINPDKYYTPEQSAGRICAVMESATPERSGYFLNWNGSEIAY